MKEAGRGGRYLLPSLFTTANLFCGFYAILRVYTADYWIAALVILIAVVFDSLDGNIARFSNATSRFGLEYDSLADLVSFGVAPGVLIYAWALAPYGRLGWVAAFLFLVCGTLRLARYNVQVGAPASRYFIGLPIPAAAGLLASTILFDHHILRLGHEIRPMLVLTMTYGLAFLMVSTIRYRTFRDVRLRGHALFNTLVTSVLVLVLFLAVPELMCMVLFSLYVLSGVVARPAAAFFRKVLGRPAPREEQVRAPDR